MVVFISTPYKGRQKYILAVQDIWSPKLFTMALTVNSPSVIATAFRIILGEAGAIPQQLNIDQGAEFTSGAFPRLLDEKGIEHRGSEVAEVVTVSGGVVTSLVGTESTSQEFYEAADKALYTAKRAGRDQVCSYRQVRA